MHRSLNALVPDPPLAKHVLHPRAVLSDELLPPRPALLLFQRVLSRRRERIQFPLTRRLQLARNRLQRPDIAVLVISSELPEIIGIADRVLVMREGRIVGEVRSTPDNPIDQETIMNFSTGALREKFAREQPF